jgi:RNA polymerase sigma factor (TIGR02999 family)
VSTLLGDESSGDRGRITEALDELRRDAPGASERLFRLVYHELRRLADAHMRRQPAGHTLQPTALVHEAYLRLMGGEEVPWRDRGHFLAASARAMRSILVDFARRRTAKKRGGGRRRVTLSETASADQHAAEEILAVHVALERLEAVDPLGSRVVQLRFFGGLTADETARVLDVATSTVFRVWEHARSWLYREIAG